MNDLNVAMVLSLKDKLLGPLSRAVDQVERDFKGLEQQATKTARASGTTADNLTKVGRAATSTRAAATEMRKLGDEAARANREVSKLEQASGRLRGLMQGMTKGVAGTMAFNHVVADPLRQAADYDTQLRRLSNTANAGKPLSERRAGMAALDQSIVSSVRGGGGTREQAMSALNELVGSGTFSNAKDASDMLPIIMRGATASGSDPVDLAKILSAAKKNMGINTPQGMSEVLDKAMAAGNAGGFELKDMAKHLPAQMALAGSIGLRGQSGLTELLVANQGAMITAGTADEAGNNVINMLGKVNSADTRKKFKDLGIDATGSIAAAQAKGMSSLKAFIALIDYVVQKDPNFAKAKAATQAAVGAEKRGVLASQQDLFTGAAISTVLEDRQALMGFLGQVTDRNYLGGVTQKTANGLGTGADAFSLMSEGAGFSYDQRNFERQKAQTDAMTAANDAVMKLADAQTDLYRKYPGFATALEGATVAVKGLAAASAGAGVVNLLTGGGSAAAAAAAGSFAAGTTAATATTLGLPAAAMVGVGAAASVSAASVVSNNLDTFGAVADNPMASAMSGDAGIAAAIMQAAQSNADRPIKVEVHLDGRQIESTVTTRQDQKARRQ
jgi:hypothetical protein